MTRNAKRTALLAVLATLLLSTTGCLSPREQALVNRMPRNQVYQPDSDVLPLDGQAYVFAEFDRTRSQNSCLMRLARDARLQPRWHPKNDLVLTCVGGRGIILVEETRYPAVPGTTVVVPRMTAYGVIPNDPGADFSAVLIFSPPFDGGDTFLVKE